MVALFTLSQKIIGCKMGIFQDECGHTCIIIFHMQLIMKRIIFHQTFIYNFFPPLVIFKIVLCSANLKVVWLCKVPIPTSPSNLKSLLLDPSSFSSTSEKFNFSWPVNLSINVCNSFNCQHLNKSNDRKAVNLSIDVINSFNSEHLDKFNDSRAFNLSIDVSTSFNSQHPDKFNDSRDVNLSIDVGKSFNFDHHDKSKHRRAVNLSIDVGNSINSKHLDKFNNSRAVNLSINLSNSFKFHQCDKSKD